MPNYRRAKTKGATYFFTVVMHRRQKILCQDAMRYALRKAIETVRKTRPFVIDGWVLLPDHLHCIWTLPEGDADFSARWGIIKRSVTKQCANTYHQEGWMNKSRSKRKESTLWQRRFWEHQIRDEADYQRCMDYLHYNPVKHGYVANVEDWVYSSFHRYADHWGKIYRSPSEDNFGE